MRQGRHDGRVGVSLSPEAVAVLDEVKVDITKQLGFAPSYAQVVLHICKEYRKTNPPAHIDNGVEMFHNQVMKDAEELTKLGEME